MTDGINDIIEDVISSYESRIESIETIFNTTNEMLENSRLENEKATLSLRDNLATNESLRKKDFDIMMQDIVLEQSKKEKEVKDLLKNYINSQKEGAKALRTNLANFRGSISKGESNRVKEFQMQIKDIISKQDERKTEVISKLKEFQTEQKEMSNKFRELLEKGRELRISHFKEMLREFKEKEIERLAKKEQRKSEVHKMLNGFKKERMDANLSLQNAREKIKVIKGTVHGYKVDRPDASVKIGLASK